MAYGKGKGAGKGAGKMPKGMMAMMPMAGSKGKTTKGGAMGKVHKGGTHKGGKGKGMMKGKAK